MARHQLLFTARVVASRLGFAQPLLVPHSPDTISSTTAKRLCDYTASCIELTQSHSSQRASMFRGTLLLTARHKHVISVDRRLIDRGSCSSLGRVEGFCIFSDWLKPVHVHTWIFFFCSRNRLPSTKTLAAQLEKQASQIALLTFTRSHGLCTNSSRRINAILQIHLCCIMPRLTESSRIYICYHECAVPHARGFIRMHQIQTFGYLVFRMQIRVCNTSWSTLLTGVPIFLEHIQIDTPTCERQFHFHETHQLGGFHSPAPISWHSLQKRVCQRLQRVNILAWNSLELKRHLQCVKCTIIALSICHEPDRRQIGTHELSIRYSPIV